MEIAYRASRYGDEEQGEGDYINCPFTNRRILYLRRSVDACRAH